MPRVRANLSNRQLGMLRLLLTTARRPYCGLPRVRLASEEPGTSWAQAWSFESPPYALDLPEGRYGVSILGPSGSGDDLQEVPVTVEANDSSTHELRLETSEQDAVPSRTDQDGRIDSSVRSRATLSAPAGARPCGAAAARSSARGR